MLLLKGTSYFTFNIPNSKCNECNHIVKAPIKKCPKCGSNKITWYTRVIGYLRPISAFGEDRQIEANKRVYSNMKNKEITIITFNTGYYYSIYCT